LGFAAGAPTPLFLIRSLTGKPTPPVIGQFKDDYWMLRYTEDLFLAATTLLRGPKA
jgi:carbamoyl-phosphate synthase large subunit